MTDREKCTQILNDLVKLLNDQIARTPPGPRRDWVAAELVEMEQEMRAMIETGWPEPPQEPTP